MDLQKAQKQFCEGVTLGHGKDVFIMAMKNGDGGEVYALTPQHVKRLVQYLQHQITEFEKQNGVIEAEPWTPDIKSPIQAK